MKKKKNNKKHTYWYKYIIDECVLCGAGGEHKIRIYDEPKPERDEDRYEYIQFVCCWHFL